MERVKILISGVVVGVFFRAFIKENVDNLKLNGYVKNTSDGKVEVVLEGEKDKIEKLIDMCKKGPDAARVDHIEIKNEKYKGNFDGFKILQ